MTAVVVNNVRKPAQWTSGLCDICAPPGGCGLCCFVHCCAWCAAGEVAQATGGSYCMSCCVAGVLPFVAPFIWCGDRKRLQEKYGIEPREEDATACLTVFFCACCAIIQELNHIRAVGPNGNMQTTVIVTAPQPQMMMPAPAPGMGMAPQVGGYPPQQGYAPQPQTGAYQ